jgi:hypothetical protein
MLGLAAGPRKQRFLRPSYRVLLLLLRDLSFNGSEADPIGSVRQKQNAHFRTFCPNPDSFTVQ